MRHLHGNDKLLFYKAYILKSVPFVSDPIGLPLVYEALIGAIPMEDMDLVVAPGTQRLIANPESPNVPASTAKGLKY